MDMNAAMVNPATQQVSFVYVPITFYESGTSLKSFLLSLIQCCSFVLGENTDYVRDYIRILNAGINFSVFDLEEYIKKLNVDGQSENQVKKCSRCGTMIQPNVNFCSSCGMKLSGIKVEIEQGVYDPARVVARPQQRSSQAQQAQEPAYPYCETISHSAVEPQQVAPQQRNACLIRCKTGERIPISSAQFRIGKDPYNCEYCVSDNAAISRCHAVIKLENGKWFVCDLGSTNKTYIGDSALSPHVNIALENGMYLKLANEDFIFNLY